MPNPAAIALSTRYGSSPMSTSMQAAWHSTTEKASGSKVIRRSRLTSTAGTYHGSAKFFALPRGRCFSFPCQMPLSAHSAAPWQVLHSAHLSVREEDAVDGKPCAVAHHHWRLLDARAKLQDVEDHLNQKQSPPPSQLLPGQSHGQNHQARISHPRAQAPVPAPAPGPLQPHQWLSPTQPVALRLSMREVCTTRDVPAEPCSASATEAVLLTCLEVRSVRTISSSGMTWAGLKKCAPMMRSGQVVCAPTSSMLMVEVLVDKMASGRQARCRSAAKQTMCHPLAKYVKHDNPHSAAACANITASVAVSTGICQHA